MLRADGLRAPPPPGFNPHQPKRAGATDDDFDDADCGLMFQSSPAQEGWCYGQMDYVRRLRRVSILTSPRGLVLHYERNVFFSLAGFNPHQPKRAGATNAHFQDHSAYPVSILTSPRGLVLRRTGIRRPGRAATVSILTSPRGLVLLSIPLINTWENWRYCT